MRKKSIAEKIQDKARGRSFNAFTGEPEYEFWDVRCPDVLKLCREAAKRGFQAGFERKDGESKALRQIIHGGKR